MALCLLAAAPAQGANLGEVQRLAENGAVQLALDLLDGTQPALAQDAEAWMLWERERVRLLAESARWTELNARLGQLPPELPAAFVRWAMTWQARALLELGQGARARAVLRTLIWADEGPAEREAFAEWRRLVIQSYLVEGSAEDAHTAMLRYRQDYGDGGRAGRLLSARVLLGHGRAADAAQLLAGVDEPTARSLRLLALLRSGTQPPQVVMRQAKALLRRDGLAEAVRYTLSGVVAEAAARIDDYASQVIALERLFTLTPPREEQPLFRFAADDLWQAYFAYAQRVGNREQLLLGDDAAWFAALAATEQRYPVRIRSLYALLAFQAHDAGRRQEAHLGLAEHLLKRDESGLLLRRLYLETGRFANVRAVPAVVRQVLVEPALAQADIALAAQLLQGLESAPEGVDPFTWQTRRARVFILGGDVQSSASLMERLIGEAAELERAELDRLVQILFDFQTVGEHEQAYGLFDRLLAQVSELQLQLQRELLYWMADSRKAQGRQREAARLYLRSAFLPLGGGMDPWAQTACYQAAKSLAEAGLREDARTLYLRLLRATEEPGRRAVLQRDLQQLRLLQSHEGQGGD